MFKGLRAWLNQHSIIITMLLSIGIALVMWVVMIVTIILLVKWLY